MDMRLAIKPLLVTGLAVALSACGGGGGANLVTPPTTVLAAYEVSVVNLTNNQPLSPVALIGHDGAFSVFSVGNPVSVAFEVLAEGGDNTDYLAEVEADPSVIATVSGSGPIGPGATETLTIQVLEEQLASLSLSVATMLVNTNDAFTGINRIDVSAMAVGDSETLRAIAYDAGTEADTEAAGTIPGPAVGGEGFNADRDDEADRVTMHAGVVSNETGLATSVLSSQERFDNPVVQISISRTQ